MPKPYQHHQFAGKHGMKNRSLIVSVKPCLVVPMFRVLQVSKMDWSDCHSMPFHTELLYLMRTLCSDWILFFTWHIAHAFLNLPREMFLLMTSLSSWFVYSCTFGEISWVDNVILTSFPLCVCNETSPPNTSTGYCPDGICKDFYQC